METPSVPKSEHMILCRPVTGTNRDIGSIQIMTSCISCNLTVFVSSGTCKTARLGYPAQVVW